MIKRPRETILAVIVVTLVCACSPQLYSENFNQGVVYCSESDPMFMNPQLDTSVTTSDATAHQIYDRLLDYDPDSGRIVASLASSWHVSADGLSYTFNLRRDIAFHTTDYFTPSRMLTAADVLFSFNRWRLADHPYHRVSGGNYPYFDSIGLAANIAKIEAPTPYQIEITINQRDSSFLANMATDFAVILSAEYAAQLMQNNTPSRIDHYPIGTGPFQFVEYRKNQFIRFQANVNYWQGPPASDSLIFDITPKSSLRLAKLLTGECDAIAFPARVDHEIIRENDDLVLAEKAGLNIGFWAFNTSRAPFDNPKVRRALAYAVDKNTLLEAVYFNSATRAKTLVPEASWAFQQTAEDTLYNPALARQMLDEAGVPRGFKMSVWAIPVARAYNPNGQKMAALIQRYLAAVEVDVDIISYDWSTFRRALRNGEHDSVLIGWSADNGDPDNMYRPILSCDAIPSGSNRAQWCNHDFDEILDKAIQTDDIDTRKAFYTQANAMLHQQLPLLPIAHAYRYQAYRKSLKGLSINPFGGIRFGKAVKTRD